VLPVGIGKVTVEAGGSFVRCFAPVG